MNDNSIWSASGAPISASMAREQLWLTTGGQTGVIGPWSLEVTAQETPTTTVRINPGSFAIAATSQFSAIGYTSAPWQSYGRSIQEPIDVPIEKTGSSSGRTDVVGIIIKDPEWDGLELTEEQLAGHWFWEPHVARNVGSSAVLPDHFAGLGRPFLPLAQIKLGPNTETITDSMITDIRFLAVSRTHPESVFSNHDTADIRIGAQTDFVEIQTLHGIRVPQWATHAHIDGSVSGLQIEGEGHCTGQLRGRLNSDTNRGWNIYFRESAAQSGRRIHLPIQGSANINPEERGDTINFDLRVRRTFGNNATIVAGKDYTRYSLTLIFTEETAHRRGTS